MKASVFTVRMQWLPWNLAYVSLYDDAQLQRGQLGAQLLTLSLGLGCLARMLNHRCCSLNRQTPCLPAPPMQVPSGGCTTGTWSGGTPQRSSGRCRGGRRPGWVVGGMITLPPYNPAIPPPRAAMHALPSFCAPQHPPTPPPCPTYPRPSRRPAACGCWRTHPCTKCCRCGPTQSAPRSAPPRPP